jgi:uncharacterized protein (DUF1499 family)
MLRAARQSEVRMSRIATLADLSGAGGAALFACGPLAIHLGWLAPLQGFGVFLAGGLLGLAALVLVAVDGFRRRPASGRARRRRAWWGGAIGVVTLIVFTAAAIPVAHLPVINDVSTDLDDPPAFVAASQLSANRGRDMRHPGAAFARQQRASYPDLVTIELALAPDVAFERAEAAGRALGWQILRRDPRAGVIEASETSRVFRFVDDVALRVRPAAGGAIVDVRSKSRVGRGDLGANAARIRAFRAALAP